MSPLKKLRRQWLRFIADQDWEADSALYKQANEVLRWIDKLIENIGYEAEALERRLLSEQIAIMSKMLAQGRG